MFLSIYKVYQRLEDKKAVCYSTYFFINLPDSGDDGSFSLSLPGIHQVTHVFGVLPEQQSICYSVKFTISTGVQNKFKKKLY